MFNYKTKKALTENSLGRSWNAEVQHSVTFSSSSIKTGFAQFSDFSDFSKELAKHNVNVPYYAVVHMDNGHFTVEWATSEILYSHESMLAFIGGNLNES